MNKFKQIKIDYHFKLKIISYATSKTWNEAQTWAKEQGGRVPTVVELQMLSALQRIGKLDTKLNGCFWSSEEDSVEPKTYGRDVEFYSGGTDAIGYKGYSFQVLCVKDI